MFGVEEDESGVLRPTVFWMNLEAEHARNGYVTHHNHGKEIHTSLIEAWGQQHLLSAALA